MSERGEKVMARMEQVWKGQTPLNRKISNSRDQSQGGRLQILSACEKDSASLANNRGQNTHDGHDMA